MQFKIHHTPSEDSIIITGESIEECIDETKRQCSKRYWEDEDCWSEELK